jgi:hypothetical protein
MSGDKKAAIEETASKAKQLLFKSDGKLKGPDEFASLFTMQFLLPPATVVRNLNAQAVGLYFDWHGSTLVYREDIADILLAGADGDAFIDRVLCFAAAVMLDAIGSVPNAKLRTYARDRLMQGNTHLTKRGRGQKKTDNSYRDAVIVGRLIPPLLDRFNATRNAETKHTESACSITTKALASVGVHMSEKRLENIWARFAHTYIPVK